MEQSLPTTRVGYYLKDIKHCILSYHIVQERKKNWEAVEALADIAKTLLTLSSGITALREDAATAPAQDVTETQNEIKKGLHNLAEQVDRFEPFTPAARRRLHLAINGLASSLKREGLMPQLLPVATLVEPSHTAPLQI